MKYLKLLVSGLLISLLMACVSQEAQQAALAKYEFEDLTSVDSISNWRMNSWNVIDNRSLIVTSRPNDSYLLVLATPLPEFQFAALVVISSTGSRVQAGFDTVAAGSNTRLTSSIKTIYKLENEEQVKAATDQIRGR